MLWRGDDKPVKLTSLSHAWRDGYRPLYYVVTYCPGRRKWTARFEGAMLAEGTLDECTVACDANETAGVPA